MASFKGQRVKRLKFTCKFINPDHTTEVSKTELFKDSKTCKKQTPTHVEPQNRPVDPPLPPLEVEQFIPASESTYTSSLRKEATLWEGSIAKLTEAYYDTLIPRVEECCIYCNEAVDITKSHLRCLDCAAHAYFCVECSTNGHNKNQHPFHKPDVWKVKEGKYVPFDQSVYLSRPEHTCGNQTCSGIQVFDQKGRHHTVNIVVCHCEKNNVTFMRHRLWASSVENPSVAFHMDLLNWMEFLVLEAKVPLLTICQSLRWTNDLSVSQLNTLYRGIVGEPFEQFRHFKFQLRSTGLENDTLCPACPKTSGDLFISLDGNFGLVRKKNSGTSVVPPKHGEKLFVSDERVFGPYVDNAEETQIHGRTECSNFQAGTNIRSKNKSANLDVTGVFGSCCRHGVPHTFINIKKGEGLGYSLFVLDKLLAQVHGSEVKLHVLYDIACLLERHIQNKNNPSRNIEDTSLAVPIFHVYGHKSSCQVQYSTRWLPGFGLTDGEEMERLWAFLRRFSVITKEMTPSHRIDLLSDGLLHYRRRKISDIDVNLARNMEKARSLRQSTNAELRAAQHDLNITIGDIDQWIATEKDHLTATHDTDEPLTNEEKYVQLLQSVDNVTESMLECDDEDTRNGLSQQIKRLSTDATKYEIKMGLNTRWHRTGHQFRLTERALEKKRKERILKRMHRQAVDYQFIQNLQKKYSDGQAIANRLTKNVTRCSRNMKRILNEYNNSNFKNSSGNLPDQLSWVDIRNPLAELYKKVGCTNQNAIPGHDGVPSTVRENLMDVRNRFLRSEEELGITQSEMLSVLNAFTDEYESYVNYIQLNPTMHTGLALTLTDRANKVRARYLRCHGLFSRHISTPDIPDQLASPFASCFDFTDQEIEMIEMDDEDSDEES